MMSESKQGLGSLFGTYGAGDPSLNVPVTASPGSVSPYMNFDPAYIAPTNEPQFIFPEGSSAKRGRFELAFSQIGGSVFAGGAAGGLHGIYTGIKETNAAKLTGAVRRTQMLNFITKQGASSAQTLGVVALMYSLFGVAISKARGADDELNTVTAATCTGLLYKSTSGLKPSLRAGAIGFALGASYVLLTSRDRIKSMLDS